MSRPPQIRRIWVDPASRSFGPQDVPPQGDAVLLSPDEFEALRLADLEGLYQDSAAQVMAVSRPTFARILVSARRKVADAIVNARIMNITEGTNTMIETMRKFTCKDCGKEFEAAYGSGRPEKCANCGSVNFNRVGGCGAQLRRRRNVNVASASGDAAVVGSGRGQGGLGMGRGGRCGGRGGMGRGGRA